MLRTRDHVGLPVGEMIARPGEMRLFAVHGEEFAGTLRRSPILARRRRRPPSSCRRLHARPCVEVQLRHYQVVKHPAFIPAGLVVDDEQPGDVVKMSMNDPTSLGSVGRPGFGSSTTRTAPIVDSCPLAALAAVGSRRH